MDNTIPQVEGFWGRSKYSGDPIRLSKKAIDDCDCFVEPLPLTDELIEDLDFKKHAGRKHAIFKKDTERGSSTVVRIYGEYFYVVEVDGKLCHIPAVAVHEIQSLHFTFHKEKLL